MAFIVAEKSLWSVICRILAMLVKEGRYEGEG